MPRTSVLEIGQNSFFYAQLGYFPEIVGLFNESDFRSKLAKHPDAADDAEDEDGAEGDDEFYDFYGYESTVQLLRQRLSALGISASSAISELEKAIAIAQNGSQLDRDAAENAKNEGFPDEVLSLDEIIKRVMENLHWNLRDAIESGSSDLEPPRYEDPRVFSTISVKHHVRFLIDLFADPITPVRMNFTDLKNDSCCYEMPENVATKEKLDEQTQMSTSLPLLVLTEGSTDASAISAAMKITHPHLDGYIKFMDFQYKPDSGTSNVVRAMRAMASAGIPNRIVAILDNDTAGHEEIARELDRGIPPGVRLFSYPDLSTLTSYPTHSLDGQIVNFDVNGSAASLELYFGDDILTSAEGKRVPVRWTTYSATLKRYQGVVESKASLHKAFMEKVKRQLADPQAAPGGDWAGMKAIIDSIVHAFDS